MKNLVNDLKNAVEKYLDSDKPFSSAMLIEGVWGIGKTHNTKEALELIKLEKNKKVVYVTCIGAKNIDDIKLRILDSISINFKKKKVIGRFFTKLAPSSMTLGSSTGISAKLNFGILNFTIHKDWTTEFTKKIKKRKSYISNDFILVLDDIERACMDFNEIFGLINSITVNDDANMNIKTICICNSNCYNINEKYIQAVSNIKHLPSTRCNYGGVTDRAIVNIENLIRSIFYQYLDLEKLRAEEADYWNNSFVKLKDKIFSNYFDLNNYFGDLSYIFNPESTFANDLFNIKFSNKDLLNINSVLQKFVRSNTFDKNIRKLIFFFSNYSDLILSFFDALKNKEEKNDILETIYKLDNDSLLEFFNKDLTNEETRFSYYILNAIFYNDVNDNISLVDKEKRDILLLINSEITKFLSSGTLTKDELLKYIGEENTKFSFSLYLKIEHLLANSDSIKFEDETKEILANISLTLQELLKSSKNNPSGKYLFELIESINIFLNNN